MFSKQVSSDTRPHACGVTSARGEERSALTSLGHCLKRQCLGQALYVSAAGLSKHGPRGLGRSSCEVECLLFK